MNKLLPNNVRNPKGFTLIELLVVISIIAVLSIIGLALFGGIQNRARNDTRRADINAIATALEVNHTATGYVVLAATQFASGAIPTDGPQGDDYCADSSTTALPATPAVWAIGAACPSGYDQVSTTVPAAEAFWKICSILESETAGVGNTQVYCKSNAQ